MNYYVLAALSDKGFKKHRSGKELPIKSRNLQKHGDAEKERKSGRSLLYMFVYLGYVVRVRPAVKRMMLGAAAMLGVRMKTECI